MISNKEDRASICGLMVLQTIEILFSLMLVVTGHELELWHPKRSCLTSLLKFWLKM